MTKILLVEDDKSLREIYGVRLLAEGYDIVSAGDGEEALAMAIKEKPGLIVSDVMMPKISGFDMLDILRSTTETKDIKIIMMTALSSDDQRQRSEELGADRYLVKSQVGIEDVVRTIHEVLGDVPGAATLPQAPTPAALEEPVAPAAPPVAPVTPPAALPAPEETPAAPALPQPTAPFSTPRPTGLGDRIINPIEAPAPSGPAMTDLMSQELSDTPTDTTEPVAPSTPEVVDVAPEVPPAAPAPPTMPTAPAETTTPPEHGLSFEETPTPPVTPATPPQQQ